jgi:ADP-ribose pyrophosphatase
MHPSSPVVGLEILSEKLVGREGGFLALRRYRLANVRADGTRSEPYLVDFIVRPKGIDAVVVAVWRRGPGGPVEVLLRDGLRPPLHLGRDPSEVPVPDAKRHLFFREVVAGIVEAHDRGEEGIRRRAAAEVEEEAGYRVAAADVVLLGAGTFPTPGAMPERFWLAAVEVAADDPGAPPAGDGSPMEEGARVQWMALDAAIDACVAGELEDAKTELTLRRLRDHLASR